MLSIRTCAASLFTLAAAAAFPTAAEASLAQKLGTSYGGRLGGSTTTSTWQATGDPADRYAFRTAPLRNVALQPAFMHNGAFVRLEDATPLMQA